MDAAARRRRRSRADVAFALQVVRLEVAHEAEVEQAQPAVRAEDAVVRVRVAGHDAVAPHEAEEEPEGDLADAVALRVVEARDLVGPQPFDVFGHEHAACREVRVHARHPHVGVAPEHPLEAALMLGLDLVVELVGDPLAELVQHGARVEPRREAA